jgi:mono/diheme cytochrome c family protein
VRRLQITGFVRGGERIGVEAEMGLVGFELALNRKRSWEILGAPLMIVVLAIASLGFSAFAAADKDPVQAGLATWKSAGCADCHGKFADGNPDDDDFPTGADLRTTKLDTAALKLTISCGRPGTGMPSFDESAYVVRGCYGQPPGARPDNLQPTPRTLTREEIDHVIAYLQARIIGRGKITREECLTYHDRQTEPCEDYK